MFRTLSAALVLAFALAACDSAAPDAGALVQFDGHVVTYTAVEGGAWLLQDPSGQRYEPVNLDPSFHQEGLRIHVEGRVIEDYVSVIQVGPGFRIESVERL